MFKDMNEINRLEQKGQFNLAFKKIEKLYCEYPNDNYIKLEYGKLLLKQGIQNVKKVRDIFISLLNTECRSLALRELCYLELNLGRTLEAQSYINMLMETDKSDYGFLELGRLCEYNDEIEKAREIFDKNTMFASDSHLRVISSVEVGRTYIIEKDYKTAKWFLENLFETVTKNDRKLVTLELGRLEALLGNYNEAKEYFFDLIHTSNKCYALLYLGEMEIQRRNFELARFYLEELGDNILAHSHIGDIERHLGNFDKSEYIFKNELEKRNGRLSKIGLLKLATTKGEYSKALSLLNQINKGNIKDEDIEKYSYFLNHKLGKTNETDDSYFAKQVNNYDASLAIKEGESKFVIDDGYLKREFNKDVDLNKLFGKVKESLPNLVKLRNGIFDRYIYKSDDVLANLHDQEAKLLDVTTFANTQDIIEMHPVVSEVTKYSRKVKKMSIID